jgi:hypothetical protein
VSVGNSAAECSIEGSADADTIFCLMALIVVASIIAHSSTDVLLSRWLYGQQPEGARA